jgi:YidC/Oxa1 family membrane protein insertase
MDKNLLWAVTLSIGIYALWFGVIEKRYIKPVPVSPERGERFTPPGTSSTSGPAAGSTYQAPAAVETVDRTVIESEADSLTAPDAQLRVHPRGASVVSCLYQDKLGSVELVQNPAPGFLATWPQLRFTRQASEPGTARYSVARPDGMLIEKEFLPGDASHLPRLRVTLSNPTRQPLASGAWSLNIGPGLGTVPTEQKENTRVWRACGLLFAEKGLQGKVEVFKQPGERTGPYRWVGVDNRYFLAAVVPAAGDFEAVESSLPPQVDLIAKNVTIAPGAQRAWEIPYYLGAKSQVLLSRYGCELERAIDFGFFAPLGRLLINVLDRIHSRIGNWGWSIVIMTFLIQTLLLPLTFKSMKAMIVMKKLQPEISRLQQKYSKDPSRLNAEMMELYKKSGANPLGGCLPLMLQMPVFIALFNALRNSWELHGAPWMFWVHDLSAKDPYRVLPIVMGGVMWVQNRLNPATASDPTQKAMMNWMPVIFTVMFMNTPAGLVLYWLTSSMISASLQMGLRRHFEQA